MISSTYLRSLTLWSLQSSDDWLFGSFGCLVPKNRPNMHPNVQKKNEEKLSLKKRVFVFHFILECVFNLPVSLSLAHSITKFMFLASDKKTCLRTKSYSTLDQAYLQINRDR